MRKKLIGLLLILIMLTACQSNVSIPDGYFQYDKSKLQTAVKQLSFEPDIPHFVPMEVDILISDHFHVNDTNAEALDVSLYTRNNDLLSIQFVNGEVEDEHVNAETVNIDEELTGTYIDNSYAKTLIWEKDGIYYKMIYRASDFEETEANSTITKKDLITVAESFHS